MALSSSSLFLYGLEVTNLNQNLQFQIVSGGTVYTAVLTPGFYSLTGLLSEVVKQMQSQDTAHVYTVTADRTLSGGTENRVTISTTGSYLSLLFGTGTLVNSSCASLLGFPSVDQTGATSYTGTASAGTAVTTAWYGFNYVDPTMNQKVFGNVNVSASGIKEAIVFQQQKFIQVEYRYESKSRVASLWVPLFVWMMQQRTFEFTPEITNPGTFYQVSFEKSAADAKGLAFMFTEMLSDGLPNYYKTGSMTFRVVTS